MVPGIKETWGSPACPLGGGVKNKIDLLRNVALVAAAGYVEAAVGLLAGVFIARTLGPTDYGHYAFAVWLCGVLIMGGNHALPTTSIKFVAEARGAGRLDVAAALAQRLSRLQTASSLLVLSIFAVVMLLAPLADWRDSLPLMLCTAVVAVWARASFWMRGAIGKGFELFVPENLALALTALLNLVLVSALAWRGASVEHFFILYALLGLVSTALVRWLLRRSEAIPAVSGAIPDETQRRLRRHLVLTGIVMLIVLATNRAVEMTLLKIYTTPEVVGYFAIAGALTKGAVDLLGGGMSAVLLPSMSRRFGSGGASALGGMLSEATRLYWFIGLFIAGLGLTVSDDLVHLLYGSRYDGAIPVLLWQLAVAGLLMVNGASAAVLTASDRQLDRIRVLVCALVVNLAFGLWLIPRFGLNGAIASMALTQLCETAFAWWYARRRTRVIYPFGAMARLAVAAFIAGALSLLLTHALHAALGFLVGATVFIGIYLLLSVLLRTWRAGEFELAAELLGRLGSVGGRLSKRVLGLKRYALPDLEDAGRDANG